MFRVATVLVWGLLAALLLAPPQALRAESLSEAYLLPELFDIMAEEGRVTALNDPAVPEGTAGRAGWDAAVRRIYNPDRMHDDFATALADALTPETRAHALRLCPQRPWAPRVATGGKRAPRASVGCGGR